MQPPTTAFDLGEVGLDPMKTDLSEVEGNGCCRLLLPIFDLSEVGVAMLCHCSSLSSVGASASLLGTRGAGHEAIARMEFRRDGIITMPGPPVFVKGG